MEHLRIGVINDIHGPYDDPRAVTLTLNIFKEQKVDVIFINGDLIDFYWIHGHGDKDPSIQGCLEDEVFWANEFLDKLQKQFPGVKIIFNFGNHEYRWDRWIMSKCPAAWNMFRLESMLRLDHRGVEWYPYNNAYLIPGTRFKLQHSPPSYSENFAMTSLKKKMDCSYMFGCTHRKDFATKNSQFGGRYEVWGNGCLTRTDLSESHRKVFSYAKRHENWQECASILDVFRGIVTVNQFAIESNGDKRWAIVNGKFYEE